MTIALTLLVGLALPVELADDGRALRRGETEVQLPCVASAVVEHGERVYAACPASVVVLSPATLEVMSTRAMPARVAGLHAGGASVWVELLRREAVPLDEVPTTVAPPVGERPPAPPIGETPPPPKPPKAAPAGKVVEVDSGVVVIDLGASDGLSRGDHIELYIAHEVAIGRSTSTEEERLAVGIASAVSDENSRVRLGRNERVALGVLARRTSAAATSSKIAPPRVDDSWIVGFMLRPLLALGAAGGGAIAALNGTYRHPSGAAVHAGVSPLGFGFADVGNLFAINGHVIASYDHRLFEVGFGGGWATIADSQVDDTSGLGVEQLARLGAVDGLHLQVRNTFLLYGGAFHYGGTEGIAMVPVTSRYALFGRGGGGEMGYAFGELGLRVLGVGNGDRGSVTFDATLGFAGLFGKEDCTELEKGRVDCTGVDYAGPMVGFGTQWRL